MEIRQLKTFLTVAERLNFTRAAKDLYLAQSSVSAQIKLLEEDLGVRLFDRIGRGIVLTEAGEMLRDYARRMLQMSEEVRDGLSGGRNYSGMITIRMPETIGSEYMPEVIETFSSEYPNTQIVFNNCDDECLKEELNSGRIDAAFLMSSSLSFNSVTVEALRPEALTLAASSGHPMAGKRVLSDADMQGQTLLQLRVD